jgi:predicted ester cyclase
MHTHDIVEITRSYYEQVWNQNNLDAVTDLVAPDATFNGFTPGHEGVKGIVAGMQESFPDLRYTLEDVMADGDKTVVRFTFHGTHRGVYRDVDPTDKEVSFTGIGIWRVQDGQLVEHWSNIDLYGLMVQLGAIGG